jgi:hypothetical protein
MDEIRRYNRALSDVEIAALTNCPAMPPPSLLVSDDISTRPALPPLTIVRTAGGSVIISGAGAVPDRMYWIDVSSDFQTWRIWTGVEADREGRFIYIDRDAASHPTRFYRVGTP